MEVLFLHQISFIMNTLYKFYKISVFLLAILIWQNIFSKPASKVFSQDPKIDQLLTEKRKANAAITINDKYKIQIFFGSIDDAKKNLALFKKLFRNIDGTIVFSNPSYKVWVGSYRTKIEAEKALIEFKKKFQSAHLINPNKK